MADAKRCSRHADVKCARTDGFRTTPIGCWKCEMDKLWESADPRTEKAALSEVTATLALTKGKDNRKEVIGEVITTVLSKQQELRREKDRLSARVDALTSEGNELSERSARNDKRIKELEQHVEKVTEQMDKQMDAMDELEAQKTEAETHVGHLEAQVVQLEKEREAMRTEALDYITHIKQLEAQLEAVIEQQRLQIIVPRSPVRADAPSSKFFDRPSQSPKTPVSPKASTPDTNKSFRNILGDSSLRRQGSSSGSMESSTTSTSHSSSHFATPGQSPPSTLGSGPTSARDASGSGTQVSSPGKEATPDTKQSPWTASTAAAPTAGAKPPPVQRHGSLGQLFSGLGRKKDHHQQQQQQQGSSLAKDGAEGAQEKKDSPRTEGHNRKTSLGQLTAALGHGKAAPAAAGPETSKPSSASADTKKEAPHDVKREKISVVAHMNERDRVNFKMFKDDSFVKVMERYLKVKNIDAPVDEVKFVVNGQHTLAPELTPADFDLEDGASINVIVPEEYLPEQQQQAAGHS